MRPPKQIWHLTASLALVAPLAAAGDPKPFEEILPEGTSVFLSIRSLPDFLKWYETSHITGLLKDPDMQPFFKKVNEAFETLMAEMKKQAGFTLADLKEACTGEVALAIGDPNEFLSVKDKGGDGPAILLVEARGSGDKVREILKKGLEKVERRKRDIEFRGQKITALEPREDEKEKTKSPTVYIAHAEDALLVSLSRSFLQDALANRADAAVKPLSQASDYKELRAKHGKDAAFFAYANTGRWIDKLPAFLPMGGIPTEQVPRVLEVLGLSRVRAISSATTLSPDGAKSTYFLLAPQGPGGLLSFIWTKPRALSFPSILPEDAGTAWVAQVDFGALWKTIEDAVRAFAPSGADGQDPIKMAETSLGLSLKDDLIAPLGGQVSYFQRSGKTPATPDFAFLIEIKDKEKLQATLEKFFALAPFFQKSEYLGRSVWALNVPGQAPEDGDEGGAPEASLSVMDTHLVIARSKPIVQEVLRRVGKEVKSIKDTSDFKALSGLIPASTTFICYESPQSFGAVFDELKKMLDDARDEDEDGGDEDGKDQPSPEKKLEGFEERMEKLVMELAKAVPEGKVLTKHIAGAVMWSFSDDRGIGLTHQVVLRKSTR